MHSKNYDQKPIAKKNFVVVEESPNEVLIYDSSINKVHVLTPVASAVWKNSDGNTSVSEISRKLEAELQNDGGDNLTWLALEELEKSGLLESPLNIPQNVVSRRSMMKTAAAIAALPLVTTIIAPTPALALSRNTPGPSVPPRPRP